MITLESERFPGGYSPNIFFIQCRGAIYMYIYSSIVMDNYSRFLLKAYNPCSNIGWGYIIFERMT